MIEVTCSPLQSGTSSRCMTSGSRPPIRTERLTAPHRHSQWKKSRSPCRQTLLKRRYVPAGSFSPFSCLLSSRVLMELFVCLLVQQGEYCPLCGKHSNSERQWQQHITTEKHKQRVFSGEGEEESLAWSHRFPGRCFSLCPRFTIISLHQVNQNHQGMNVLLLTVVFILIGCVV